MTLETIYDGDGSDVTFNTNFDYLEQEDISVAVKPSGGSYASKTLDTHYTVSGQVVTFTSGNTPPNNSKVRIRRHTPVTHPRHTHYAGSTITAKSLNDNVNQILNALEERGLAVDDETDQPFTIGTHNEIKVNSATNLEVVPGSITLNHMAINSIDSDQYVDGSIDRVHLAADIIDGTKIADDVINSEHYVDGSIDHQHLSNDCVDGSNIQDNAINSEHYAGASIDNEHLAADAVDSEHLADGAVDLAHLSASGTKNSTTFLRGDNTWHATSSLGLFTSYAILKHVESQGSHGGSSGTSWTTRIINTEDADPDGIVSISSNQFTLQAGNYFINLAASSYDNNYCKLRIYDITNSAERILGHVGAGGTYAYGWGQPNQLTGRLTPSGATVYEAQQISGLARSGTGHGHATSMGGNETFLTLQIFKES